MHASVATAAFTEALSRKETTRFFTLPAFPAEEFHATFLADGIPFALHDTYGELGATGITATRWAASGSEDGMALTRTVRMTRSLQGTPQVVVQHVHLWRLGPRCLLVRAATTTPEWTKAKAVTSIEMMLVCALASGMSGGHAAAGHHHPLAERAIASFHASGATVAVTGSSAASGSAAGGCASAVSLLACVYDVDIQRSGLGMFVPVDYAR